jgi:hypothetical protein
MRKIEVTRQEVCDIAESVLPDGVESRRYPFSKRMGGIL